MEPEVVVLLSGGIDSAACVDFYIQLGRPPCGMFIDYGQPAAANEAQSATAISKYYSIPLISLTWKGHIAKGAGLIEGRNCFLLAAAVMECPQNISVIAMGIHDGTNYVDCSQLFLERMQTVLNLYSDRRRQLAAPFVTWTKSDIYSYCHKRKIPVELTYSCEQGGPQPCENCLSCTDREMLHAGA